MSTGSSYLYGLNITSFGNGLLGPTGPTGVVGLTGATGRSLTGGTGGTGPSLINITKETNGYWKYWFNDGSNQFSDTEILGYPGYSKVKITGQTLGAFSLLRQSQSDTTDSDGIFPVDVLTFRGISTATPDYVKIEYIGDNQIQNGIKITYDLINVGYIGLSGGTFGNIIQNLPGQFQAGITGTKYDENENAILIQHRNVQEGLVIARPTVISPSIAYWKIDPSQGSSFYIVPNNTPLTPTTQINGLIFFIKKPQYGNLSKAISLHFDSSFNINNDKVYYVTYSSDSQLTSGITFASTFSNRFDIEGVNWQNDSYFCPPSNRFGVLNLISFGNRYFAIPAQYNETSAIDNRKRQKAELLTTCYPFSQPTTLNPLLDGLCCPKGCTSSPSETIIANCSGYFIPTKGISSQSLCSRKGSCCTFKDGNYSHTEKTYCECMENGLNANKTIWHPFEGLKTQLNDFDCSSSLVGLDLGACCDGKGGCDQVTEQACIDMNRFFQGIGVLCGNICSGGSGGCCDSGITCSNGITGETCIANGKTYLGDQKYCQTYDCAPDKIPCFQTIPGMNNLKQGDEYSGGIIAGIFNIKSNDRSEVYGHRVFGNLTSQVLTNLASQNGNTLTNSFKVKSNSQVYKTIFDYSGYGFSASPENLSEQNESFMIIVAKEDLKVGNDSTFVWSKKQFMWGPLFDPTTSTVLSGENNFWLSGGVEGHIRYNSNSPTYTIIANNSSTDVGVRQEIDETGNAMNWIFSKSPLSITGKWARNYGLLNTARIVGSKYARTITNPNYNNGNYTIDGNVSGTEISDAIIQYNTANTTLENESSWFIPSHDEMAYISNLCQIETDFNLNALLLTKGFDKIEGTYWTSTGSFDMTLNEGYSDFASIKPTMAWCFNIDSTNTSSDRKVYNPQYNYSIIANRQNKYKVRPIKIVRCDGRYALSGDENYRVWKLKLS